MSTQAAGRPSAARVERLVERSMTFAVDEYDDDLAVARLAWVAQDDQAALDQACDARLSYTDVDLAIRGRAIGLLARVMYHDLPTSGCLQSTRVSGHSSDGRRSP